MCTATVGADRCAGAWSSREQTRANYDLEGDDLEAVASRRHSQSTGGARSAARAKRASAATACCGSSATNRGNPLLGAPVELAGPRAKLLRSGYETISYNRRIISPPRHQIVCDCEPRGDAGPAVDAGRAGGGSGDATAARPVRRGRVSRLAIGRRVVAERWCMQAVVERRLGRRWRVAGAGRAARRAADRLPRAPGGHDCSSALLLLPVGAASLLLLPRGAAVVVACLSRGRQRGHDVRHATAAAWRRSDCRPAGCGRGWPPGWSRPRLVAYGWLALQLASRRFADRPLRSGLLDRAAESTRPGR